MHRVVENEVARVELRHPIQVLRRVAAGGRAANANGAQRNSARGPHPTRHLYHGVSLRFADRVHRVQTLRRVGVPTVRVAAEERAVLRRGDRCSAQGLMRLLCANEWRGSKC